MLHMVLYVFMNMILKIDGRHILDFCVDIQIKLCDTFELI